MHTISYIYIYICICICIDFDYLQTLNLKPANPAHLVVRMLLKTGPMEVSAVGAAPFRIASNEVLSPKALRTPILRPLGPKTL